MNKLELYLEGNLIQEVELEGECSIGRNPSRTIQLQPLNVSRVQAVLSEVNGAWCVRDMSRNGLLRNGSRIDPQVDVVLETGDRLSFAGFEAVLSLDAAAPDPQPAAAPPAKVPAAVVDEAPEPSPLMSHLVENREATQVWSDGEMELRLADIIEETDTCKTYRLVGSEPTLFSFKPGQFLTLNLDIDGEAHKRSYSISSTPSRPHTLELTIKRVPGGLVSNWMADEAKLGDTFKVRGPAGKFSCFNYPTRRMLFIGAGSGITPLMSMLRWIVDTAADVDVILLASFHAPQDIIFRKELEQLAARHSGIRILLTLTSAWSGTEAWTGLRGYVDSRMLQFTVPDLNDRHVFMCGPKPFSNAVKEQLKELDFPMAQLHTESFGSGRVSPGTKVEPKKPAAAPEPAPAAAAPEPVPAKPAAPAEAAQPAEAEAPPAEAPAAEPAGGVLVRFAESDVEVRSDGTETLLEIAEVNGVDLTYGCRAGACGVCQVKLQSGEVELADCDLDEAVDAEGMVHTCVTRPKSDVTLEA